MTGNQFVVRRGDVTKLVEVRDLTNDELAALVYDNNYPTKDVDEERDGIRIVITAPGEKLTYFPKGFAIVQGPTAILFYLSINPDMASISARLRIASGTGSGNYKVQARGNNLGAAWTDIATAAAAGTSGEFDLATIDIDGTILQRGKTYAFRVVDTGTGFECQQVLFTIPAAPGSVIEAIFAGSGPVEMNDNGGGSLDFNFPILPDSVQLPAGVTILNYDRRVSFWHLFAETPIDNTPAVVADSTVSVSGNTDGVYVVTAQYNLSNGKAFILARIVGLDSTAAIVQDVKFNGCTVDNISGLDMDVTVHAFAQAGTPKVFMIAVGATLPDSGVILANGEDANIPLHVTVPAGTEMVAVGPGIDGDTFIETHFDHDFFPFFSLQTAAL